MIAVMQTEQGRSRGYEGLDPTELESIRAPPIPHQYAGLAGQGPIQGPAAGSPSPTESIDQHGYLQVIADPDNGDQTGVCCIGYVKNLLE